MRFVKRYWAWALGSLMVVLLLFTVSLFLGQWLHDRYVEFKEITEWMMALPRPADARFLVSSIVEGSAMHGNSLVVYNDEPMIAHRDSKGLCFSQIEKVSASSKPEWSTHVVHDGSKAGKFCSLVMVDGTPTILSMDKDDDCIYIHQATATQPVCQTDWQSCSISMQTVRPGATNLVATSDHLAFLCIDAISGSLQLALSDSLDVNEETDWNFSLVDTQHPAKSWFWLVANEGRFHAVYHTDVGLKYAIKDFTALRVNGTWQTMFVDRSQKGKTCQLRLISGIPCVSYRGEDPESVWFAYASSPNPCSESDWTAMQVYYFDSVSFDIALGEYGGKPIIAYSNMDCLMVFYAKHNQPVESKDWVFVTANNQPELEVIGSCSVFGSDDELAISYYEYIDYAIRYSTLDGAINIRPHTDNPLEVAHQLKEALPWLTTKSTLPENGAL